MTWPPALSRLSLFRPEVEADGSTYTLCHAVGKEHQLHPSRAQVLETAIYIPCRRCPAWRRVPR